MEEKELNITQALQVAVKNLCATRLFFEDEKKALIDLFGKLLQQASPQQGLGISPELLLDIFKSLEAKTTVSGKAFFTQDEITALCEIKCPTRFTFRYYALGSRIDFSAFPKVNLSLRKNFGSALHDAVNDYAVVRLLSLVQEGADVNVIDGGGNSPLHFAAAKGYVEAVRLLVKYGASLECRNKNGCTPLALAVEMGHTGVVALLLERRAETTTLDVNVLLRNHNKALLSLLRSHMSSLRWKEAARQPEPLIVQCIDALKQCYVFDAKEKKRFVDELIRFMGNDQVYHAQTLEICLSALNQYFKPEELREILQRPVFANFSLLYCIVREMDIPTALTKLIDVVQEIEEPFYILKSSQDVIRAVSRGVDLERGDPEGKTQLHRAVISENFPVTDELIRQCPGLLDRCDKDGKTALHYAAMQGNSALINLLRQKGASLCIHDNQDFAPKHYAMESGHDSIVTSLEMCTDPSAPLRKPVFLAGDLAKAAADSPRNADPHRRVLEEHQPGLLSLYDDIMAMRNEQDLTLDILELNIPDSPAARKK